MLLFDSQTRAIIFSRQDASQTDLGHEAVRRKFFREPFLVVTLLRFSDERVLAPEKFLAHGPQNYTNEYELSDSCNLNCFNFRTVIKH